jgi:hypothetical protein
LLALLVAAPLFAAEGEVPLTRNTNDRQIIDLLARVHDQGAALFNTGDHGGCYRMFQGALVTAKLVLPKELQDLVDRGLSRAEMQADPVRRAMALHDVIEDVRRKLHPTAGRGELLPKPRGAGEGGGSGAKPLPTVPGVPEPPPGKLENPPKLGSPAKPLDFGNSPKIGTLPKPPELLDLPHAPPYSSPEPPKAPAAPPGRINLADPPPPVLSGLPTSNPKSPKPLTEPKPAMPVTEPLPVAPRPAEPAGPSPFELPPGGDPLGPPLLPNTPKAPTSPAPPSGPELNPPPLDLPPATEKPKPKSDGPPPLTPPGK